MLVVPPVQARQSQQLLSSRFVGPGGGSKGRYHRHIIVPNGNSFMRACIKNQFPNLGSLISTSKVRVLG